MYRIVLKNVGKDMVNKDFTVESSDINGAAAVAFSTCSGILGEDELMRFSVVGEEIIITVDNYPVGSLTITKLN